MHELTVLLEYLTSLVSILRRRHVIVQLGFGELSLLKEQVSIRLTHAHLLIDQVELLGEEAEETRPIWLFKVAEVVMLDKDLHELLQLHLWLIRVFAQGLE